VWPADPLGHVQPFLPQASPMEQDLASLGVIAYLDNDSLDLDNFLDVTHRVELDRYLPQESPMEQDLASLCLPGVIGHFDHIHMVAAPSTPPFW